MEKKQETIGFIGLGQMGHGIAKNILDKGYSLTFFSRKPSEAVNDLIQRGGIQKSSAKEVAQSSTMVVLCVTGSRDVEELVRGSQGLAMGLTSGSVVIDCSTSDPTSTKALCAELATLNVTLVDAPLSRTPKEAWEGTLDTMVGAEPLVFERVKPLLQTWAARIVHVGGPGDGHRMKLINNFISLGYAALYAEALTLAKAVNISPDRFDAVIRNGRMDCAFYQTFMEYTLRGDKSAHKFTLGNAFKDLRYLESMSDDAGITNSIGNAVKNTFALALHHSSPDNFVPMLAEHIAALSQVDLRPSPKG